MKKIGYWAEFSRAGGLFQMFQLFQLFFVERGKDAKKGVKIGNSGGLIRIETGQQIRGSLLLLLSGTSGTHIIIIREKLVLVRVTEFFFCSSYSFAMLEQTGTSGTKSKKFLEQIGSFWNKNRKCSSFLEQHQSSEKPPPARLTNTLTIKKTRYKDRAIRTLNRYSSLSGLII